MGTIHKENAILKLKELIGQDLRPLADKFKITVFTDKENLIFPRKSGHKEELVLA